MMHDDKYCNQCGEKKLQDGSTAWVGMLYCRCDEGLPPARCKIE